MGYEIKIEDCLIETFRVGEEIPKGSDTSSGLRITHTPTKISFETSGRPQREMEQTAMLGLRKRIAVALDQPAKLS